MRLFAALKILEAAILESKKRDIDTAEVSRFGQFVGSVIGGCAACSQGIAWFSRMGADAGG